MALFDRLNDLARNITDKTTDAIETGKFASKANSEKNLAGGELKKIGEYYYGIFAAGGEVAPEILEFCTAAKAHYDAAAEAQAEIDRIRAENEAERAAAAAPTASAAPAGLICPGCGAAIADGLKFCGQCGTKIEVPAAPVSGICPACGAAVADGVRFCGACGARME